MEIIKPGDPDRKNEVYTFTCKKCGCVFRAGRGEWKYDFSQRENADWYSIECPFCKGRVTLYGNEARNQRRWGELNVVYNSHD